MFNIIRQVLLQQNHYKSVQVVLCKANISANQGKNWRTFKMKSIFVTVVLLSALALTLPAHAGYAYLAGSPDSDRDGDGTLSTVVFSTLNGCQSAAAAASNVVQGCFGTCDPANSKSAFYIEQQGDGDSDSLRFMNGVGPYG